MMNIWPYWSFTCTETVLERNRTQLSTTRPMLKPSVKQATDGLQARKMKQAHPPHLSKHNFKVSLAGSRE